MSRITKLLTSGLLLSLFPLNLLFAQTSVSGVINKYSRVTSIATNYISVNNESQFSQFNAGDTILLIQMKGVRMSVFEDISFGSGMNYNGEPGKHEFHIVKTVEPGPNKIIFTTNISTSFSTIGDVQIIKVPYFNNAIVSSALTCQPWDSISKTGGVLVAVVGNSLTLAANIDVTDKGFKGGIASAGKGICIETNTIKWNKYAYSALSDSAGFKGEGLAVLGDPGSLPYLRLYPEYGKGRGANFTGGGGGNGKYSGGGGGANFGAGGRGGREMSDACLGRYGGEGGKAMPITGLYLGGGGGASTYNSGFATHGNNGGGIVILVCDTLKGNGHSIQAEGGSPVVSASGTAGAGGGGGGGSIAIYLNSFSENILTSGLSIKAGGGKGGDNTGQTFAEGGGGGGGLITTNNISVPANVNKTNTGGLAGTKLGSILVAQAGSSGLTETTFKPVFSGFLFNSIQSSVSGSALDSISSGMIPKEIIGSIPIGGSGIYSYSWQKSYNLSSQPTIITGATSKNYIPTLPEVNTLWIRRIIRDENTLLTDTSKWVKIRVILTTSAEEIRGNRKLGIFPNPASDETLLSFNDPLTGTIEIMLFDLTGRKIRTIRTEKINEEFNLNIQIPYLPNGLYHIQIIINRTVKYSGRLAIVR